jgi:hypothetical protein
MTKPLKLLLGIGTAIPLAYVLFILFVFSDFHYDTIFRIHLSIMALYGILLIVYPLDVGRNARLPDDKRALWRALVFVGSSVAQLIYFCLYIWPGDDE